MAPQAFPAKPEDLFSAVYNEYKALNLLYDERQRIWDDILKLNEISPYPFDEGRALQRQLDRLSPTIQAGEDHVRDLNQTAMIGVLKSADVANAKEALTCSIDKIKLALNSMDEFENFLAVAKRFVEFAAQLSAAAAGAPLSVLAIANLIKEVDDIIKMTLKETLTKEEFDQLKQKIMADCSKAGG